MRYDEDTTGRGGRWTRGRLAAAAAVALAAVAAGEWGVLAGPAAARDQARARWEELRARNDATQPVVEEWKRFLEGQQEALARFEEVLAQIPPEEEQPSVLNDVQALGVEAGVSIDEFRPGEPRLLRASDAGLPALGELPVRLGARCGYFGLLRLFGAFKTFPRLITVTEFAIDHTGRATIEAKTYFKRPPAEAAPGAAPPAPAG
jgi:type IV pilus assembly protein PilO